MDHLTRVVLEAERRGLSYGKYVAMHHEGMIGRIDCEIAEPPVPAPSNEPRHCVVCGVELHPEAHKNRKTCSSACSAANNRRRNLENYRKKAVAKEPVTQKCVRCGKPFIKHRSNHIFCGGACRKAQTQDIIMGRNAGSNQEAKIRNYGSAVCRVCGAEFIKRSHNSEICSAACRKKQRR